MPVVPRPIRWPASTPEGQRKESVFNFSIGAERGGVPEGVAFITGEWPGVRAARQAGSADAGPTGKPWVNANGWRVQQEQGENPKRTVWLDHGAAGNRVLTASDYMLAMAEAETYGARWVVSEDAVVQLPALTRAAVFFAEHEAWAQWETVASAGVISDFQGPVKFLAQEVLNLAARRTLPLRVLTPQRAEQESALPESVRAWLYLASTEPTAALRKKLWNFVDSGGLLLSPSSLQSAQSGAAANGYQWFSRGKGRIGVPEKKWSDPYALAADLHLLLGREHDTVRLYNTTAVNVHYTAAADGARGVVQILQYSGRRNEQNVTVALGRAWKSALFYTLAGDKSATLSVTASRFGSEIAVPTFSTYAAIELEA